MTVHVANVTNGWISFHDGEREQEFLAFNGQIPDRAVLRQSHRPLFLLPGEPVPPATVSIIPQRVVPVSFEPFDVQAVAA